MQPLHVGTSGWSYKHWQGIFYPADVKPARYLEYYVTQFSCVELNASFYRVPGAAMIPHQTTGCAGESRTGSTVPPGVGFRVG